MQFSEIMTRAVETLTRLTAQKAADGEITDEELDGIQGELEDMIAAIEYERECRDTARQAAQGHAADLNRAQKI